ncbi:hypothetical protein [Mycobacterium sp. GA-2829]|uniref:hypothetical protein n=1 Tax=Mycobacterium sp. GA-2829 TaxID=1772283 RepID=UPI000ADEBDBD|nr:hypothetical protein [Mycobacterium sp. GA-2829]
MARAVRAVAAGTAAPLRVAVDGRVGVGRATLARALSAAEWRIVEDGADPDAAVVVVAEAVKPEDAATLTRWREAGVPVLLVRNKADLAGAVPVDALPVVALLADVRLDDASVDALRVLTEQPADLRSVDAFVDGPHPLPRAVRQHLLRTLDRRGVAHTVRALRDGAEPADLLARLRALSNIDGLLAELAALTAPVRYRRIRSALADLQALAAGSEAVADFLTADETVLAVMAAAVDVVRAAGLTVDPADHPAAHLHRAVRWRAYSRGPVGPLHRACGADISRGSLRLFARRR